MPINLTNRNDIECDSLTIINNNGRMNVGTSITNLNNTVNSVTGIPIETLNSIQKIGEAIDNDPQFFTNINNKIDNKQNKFLIADASVLPANTSHLFDENNTGFRAINVSAPLSITTHNYEYVSINCDSYDKENIDNKLTTINTNINAKQATLVAGLPAVSGLQQSILSGATIKNIIAGTGISLASGVNNITITGIDAYTKSAVDTKISDLIGSAPAVLNTLQEIASLIGDSSTVTTTLINAIASKANLSETFIKSSIGSDVYLAIGNKRLVSLGTTENKLVFEIQDTMGTSFNDAYYPAITFQMNTTTKQISCYIPNSLFINNVNVMNEIGLKVNSADLSNYALNTSLSSYLKLDFNQLLVPKIVLTDTNVGPPITGTNSVGSRLVLYNLQNTNNLRTNIAIGVEANSMWFGIDGANASLTGGFRFYNGINKICDINGQGSITCEGINCSALTIGTTLTVQCNLSTFERNIFVGTLEAVNVDNITTVGGIQVGNKLRVNGLIETGQLRSIGATATDGVTIFNIENNMVAKFYNDYHTVLNGPTHMLGDVYCSHKIDCYRFTATEIIPRDSLNNLSFKNFGNATAIEINDTAVEIKQPLKVQSTTNSVFNYGASFGILQPASTLGIHCYSSASIGGNLTVDGFIAAKPYISIKVATSVYSSGLILAVPSTSSVIGTPGAVTQTNMGYQSATLSRGTVANSNYFLYTFTFPAHPLGSLFAVGCTFLTGGTSNPTPNAIFTATNTSTTITVWIRETSTNILRDGNFYVYSIP